MALRTKQLLNQKNDNTVRRIRRILSNEFKDVVEELLANTWKGVYDKVIKEYIPEDTGTLVRGFIDDGLKRAKDKFTFTAGFRDVHYAVYQNNKRPPPGIKTKIDWYKNHPKSPVFNGHSKPDAGPAFLDEAVSYFEDRLHALGRTIGKEMKSKWNKRSG